MRGFYFGLLSALVLVACSQELPSSDQGASTSTAVPLVKAADGTLYYADCLKQNALQDMASCQYTGAAPTSSQVGIKTGLSAAQLVLLYYVLNPQNYQENQFCNGVFGVSTCYSNFGYTASYYPTYYQPQCGTTCYYSTNYNTCMIQNQCWNRYWWY